MAPPLMYHEEDDSSSRAHTSPSWCHRHRHRHSLQIVALCCCSFTNAFLVISVFPYAAYMVLDLVPNTATTENAGIYAGLVSSSFFAARFFTAFQWGRLADAWGRVRILQLALSLSALFSVLFGLSKSLPVAILWRGCLGASNCLIGTTKTLAAEIAEGNEKIQRRTMGLVVGMRSWGMLVAPAIAGFLAEPLTQYPGLFADKTMHPGFLWLLETYPFLLPNLFGAFCCMASILTIHLLLDETLPKETETDVSRQSSQTSRSLSPDEGTLLLLKQPEKSGSTVSQETPVWSRPLTRSHMIAHWMFSIISTYVDEAFPLFCISVTGGLALRESDIGTIMSGAGILFALFQYCSFAVLSQRLGLYRSMILGCLFGTLPTAFMPLAILLQRNGAGRSSWWFAPFLSFVMGIAKLFHSLFFTSMAVAINKTVDSSQRARMNGLVTTGNSVSKAVGPSFAGLLVTLSFSSLLFPSKYGSLLIWSFVPLMGAAVALRVGVLHRQVAVVLP